MNRNKIIRMLCILSVSTLVLTACTNEPDAQPGTTQPTVAVGEITEPATQLHEEETLTSSESLTTEPYEPITVFVPDTEPSVSQTVPAAPATKPTAETESTTQPESATELTTQAEQTTAKQPYLQQMLDNASTMAGYYFISRDEIGNIADSMVNDSKIYYVRLQDGTNTFYIAVDLQTAQALALANPQVLKEVCVRLEQAQQQQAQAALQGEESDEYVLMDYTHLVGELEIHFVGYLLTGALGGEDGPLAGFYNSCKVADLNIDESRFGPIIDVIGTVVG